MRNARNTKIAGSRLRYGVRLPHERADAGEGYTSPGPVKMYVLEGEEREGYAPVRPTRADLVAAAEAGWPWQRVAATWKLKGPRANALREVYYRLRKEEPDVEEFEVYGADEGAGAGPVPEELTPGVNPPAENALEGHSRLVQGPPGPEGNGIGLTRRVPSENGSEGGVLEAGCQTGESGAVQTGVAAAEEPQAGEKDDDRRAEAAWVPPTTLYESHPLAGEAVAETAGERERSGAAERPDPLECVRRGLPLSEARQMAQKDLTPEIARELLAAGVNTNQIARLYGYRSAGSLREKLARWGVWRIKWSYGRMAAGNACAQAGNGRVRLENERAHLEERMARFETILPGLACPWPPGLEARVARLERLLEDIARAEEHGSGKDIEERYQHVLDNLAHLAARVQELRRDLDVVKLALTGWAERAACSCAGGGAAAVPEEAARERREGVEVRLARVEEQYERVVDAVSRLAAAVTEAGNNARAARLYAEDVREALDTLKDEYGRHRHQVGPGHWSSRPEV
jgi:hypothetical protein